MKQVTSYISKKKIPLDQSYQGGDLQTWLFDMIKKQHPKFTKKSYISREEVGEFRKKYFAHLVNQERGELNRLQKEVIESITENKLLADNIEEEIEEELTLGEKLADGIATFGGSWTFLITFFSFLVLWMIVNVVFLTRDAFDPYPFILLNLLLSCLASVQAPIIMMSQNRQGEKDRNRSEHDYQVNLKAELEVKLLHEKMDYLISHQNKRLLEIQALQTDYLQDLLSTQQADEKKQSRKKSNK